MKAIKVAKVGCIMLQSSTKKPDRVQKLEKQSVRVLFPLGKVEGDKSIIDVGMHFQCGLRG